MKILVIGNIGAGKTTLSKKLLSVYPSSYFISLDLLRKIHGDNSMEQEYFALSKFSSLLEKNHHEHILILEFTGAGPHKHAFLQAIKNSNEPTVIIYVQTIPNTCKQRIKNRKWSIPYPWNNIAQDYIDHIHEELELDYQMGFWETSNTHIITYQDNQPFTVLLTKLNDITSQYIRMTRQLITPYEMFDKITLILKALIQQLSSLRSLLTYGSYARNTHTLESDLDFIIIHDNSITHETLTRVIINLFETNEFKTIQTISYSDKVIFYMTTPLIEKLYQPFKLEIYMVTTLQPVKKYLIGSHLNPRHMKRILIINKDESIKNELQATLENPSKRTMLEEITYHLNRSIETFCLAGDASRKSDYYQFYFFLNISFHHLIVLNLILKREVLYPYLPRYAHYDFHKKEQAEFNKLLDFPILSYHNRKETLQKFKIQIIKTLKLLDKKLPTFKITKQFPEKSLTQLLDDYIHYSIYRNFRDIASIDFTIIQRKKLYRSAALSIMYDIDTNDFQQFLNQYDIKAIIDLRDLREYQEFPYPLTLLTKLNIQYYHVPFNVNYNEELTYDEREKGKLQFYKDALKIYEKQLSQVFKILSKLSTPAVIHCSAGKDRTGLVIFLLYKLLDIPDELIQRDFLTSQRNVKIQYLSILQDQLNHLGGIYTYLTSIGVTINNINMIKQKFKRNK